MLPADEQLARDHERYRRPRSRGRPGDASWRRARPLRIKLGVDPDRARPAPRATRCRCASSGSSRTSATPSCSSSATSRRSSAIRPGRNSTRPPLTRRADRRQRRDLRRAGVQDPRSRQDRAAPQLRLARPARLRGPAQADEPVHGRPHPRARRLLEALRVAAVHLAARVPLPDRAGVRLGRDRGRRRARAAPTSSSTCSPGAS